MAKFYLTTTLPYVNAEPHIGFALEVVQADAVARYHRLMGDEVFFNLGADEHGQKIFEAAEKEGKAVQEYVDHYAARVEGLTDLLNLSSDAFIRTTSAAHIAASEEMWRLCDAAGDIYKKSYTGRYCVGCEAYKTEKEIEGGKCVLHPSLELQTITEENYFFRFSKYQQPLLEYLSRTAVIVPEWRREEALNFVKGGLEDFSISREKVRLSWGIPVPTDPSQVMYVWFDALTSYISTLGWPTKTTMFKEFWELGTAVQMAGKDQVRFQSLMWQAMLMSAGIKNTDQIFYHGFINSGGQRMSKSLGNVISPYELVEKYGVDATRYLLLRHVHPFEDSDVTWERLTEWYNAGLANGLGNLVARVMKLAEDNLDAPIARAPFSYSRELENSVIAFEFNKAMDSIWDRIQALDQRIQTDEPYRSKDKMVIAELVVGVRDIGNLLTPFMPETSAKVLAAVAANKKPENLFSRIG